MRINLSDIKSGLQFGAAKTVEVFLVLAPIVMLTWIIWLMGSRSLTGAMGLIVLLCLYIAISERERRKLHVGGTEVHPDAIRQHWLVRLKKSIFSYVYVGDSPSRKN